MIDLGGYDARKPAASSAAAQDRVFRMQWLRNGIAEHEWLLSDDRYASSRGVRMETLAKLKAELASLQSNGEG